MLVLALLALAGGAPTARASSATSAGPPTALAASFTPKRLGATTAVKLAIRINSPYRTLPAAISQLDLDFPSDLGFATSGLGVAECDPAALQREGELACPANSRIGGGSATVAVAFGPAIVDEHVTLGLFAAPSSDGYVHLAILATGREPINARIVMSGVIHPGRLRISVPPVPSVPGAGDVAIVALQATLGGALTYYERSHGHTVAYRPRGIALPDRCPAGGWRMSARVTFADGSVSGARSVVGCPRRTGRR